LIKEKIDMQKGKDFYPKEPIRYGRQSITQDDIDEVVSVLNSDWLTQGPKVGEFEEKFAEYVGSKYAVAVSNGTAALHISAQSLDVGVGSRVITTPITFVATGNAVRFCGGEVHFADIDPETYLLDLDKVRELIKSKPKGYYEGIIPVDFAGRSVNMEAFRALAGEHGLWIIEDAAHAPGGYFVDSTKKEQRCGNGNFVDLAIFSFHPVKHIACGEGGMITTNDEKLYKRLLTFRSHGITAVYSEMLNSKELAYGSDEVAASQTNYPLWYMEMQNLGCNYRLTELQAGLGVSQLRRAKEGIEKRRFLAKKYSDAFSDSPFVFRQSSIVVGHAYHLYVLEVKDRLGLYKYLMDKNIYVQIHYIPMHLMPYYSQFGWKRGDMPNAENYYKNCVSIPMFPSLTGEQQEYVIKTIKEYYG
jgi:UDP-4-amino-4,6-dideoxy-N-acetyl-beta-L-altrosamine transaminase